MEVDVAQLLAEHGRNPFSGFVRYEAPWQWFETADGAVPYLARRRVALAWADPLAEDPVALLGEFTRGLRGHRLCLMLIGEDVARAARALGYVVLKIGEQPHFDFATWRVPRGDPGKHLRWCLNLARRAGVEVREYGAG